MDQWFCVPYIFSSAICCLYTFITLAGWNIVLDAIFYLWLGLLRQYASVLDLINFVSYFFKSIANCHRLDFSFI